MILRQAQDDRGVDLVPFEFDGFTSRESYWPNPHSVRFPRAEIARIFGAAGHLPVKAIDKIIERNPQLKGMGTAVTVTAVLRKRTYKATVYDFREIYQLAVYSDLPGAREYLLKFPALLEAEVKGRLIRPDLPLAARLCAQIVSLPHYGPERLILTRAVATQLGIHRSSLERMIKKYVAGGIPGVRQYKPRQLLPKVPEPTRTLAIKLVRDLRGAKLVDIEKVLDGKVSRDQLARLRARMSRAA